MILVLSMLSFQQAFSLSSCTLIKRLFNLSLLSFFFFFHITKSRPQLCEFSRQLQPKGLCLYFFLCLEPTSHAYIHGNFFTPFMFPNTFCLIAWINSQYSIFIYIFPHVCLFLMIAISFYIQYFIPNLDDSWQILSTPINI